ncbi:MAG TPA: DUF2294 domain-containing protein [Solirubrobacteraceae bacterium]|nr:DUF2294 domain-containing protein [Solirubrobacteraceae bacterium]
MDATDPAAGANLLARISNEIVKAQKHYFGKGPVGAKSYMFDDMLFVVMHGGLTTAEETMLDFGEADLVRQFRQTFENRMTEHLTGVIEDLTGRKVLTYQSQVLFQPHRVIEMFVFDDTAAEGARAATAEGQTTDGEIGEATADASLDAPSSSGR